MPPPAARAQSANPYSCGIASASSREHAGRAPRFEENSPRHRTTRKDGEAEHPAGAAPQKANRHRGQYALALLRTAEISAPAAASLHTNETASANSPCPEHERPATHRVRMSSPGVPQSPRARRFQFPAVPPSPSVAAPLVSRWRPSDCALLLLPDKDCCCA